MHMKNNRSRWKEENILISLALESAQLGIRQAFRVHPTRQAFLSKSTPVHQTGLSEPTPPYTFSHSLLTDLALGEHVGKKMKRERSFEFGADDLACVAELEMCKYPSCLKKHKRNPVSREVN